MKAIFSDYLDMNQEAAILSEKVDKYNKSADNSDWLKGVITSEETWTYGYDIEIKAQSSQRKFFEEPRPKKVRQMNLSNRLLQLQWPYLEPLV